MQKEKKQLLEKCIKYFYYLIKKVCMILNILSEVLIISY